MMLAAPLLLLCLLTSSPQQPGGTQTYEAGWAAIEAHVAEGRLDLAREAAGALADALIEKSREPGRAPEAELEEQLSRVGLRGAELGSIALTRRAFERIVELRSARLAPEHPDLLDARSMYAVALYQSHEPALARALLEELLELYSRTLPAEADEVRRVRTPLALCLRELGEEQAALALQEDILALVLRTRPEEDIEVQRARLNLAGTYGMLGNDARAAELLESVVAVHERTRPADDLELANARHNLATSYARLGRYGEARAQLEPVIAALERRVPAEHWQLLGAKSVLGVVLRQLDEPFAARPLLIDVYEVRQRIHPAGHPEIARARSALASLARRIEDHSLALRLSEEALADLERSLPPDHPRILVERSNLALELGEIGDLSRARRLQESVIAPLARHYGEESENVHIARYRLASVLARQGETAEASALLESVISAFERVLGPEDPRAQAARLELSGLLQEMGNIRRAVEVAEHAYRELEHSTDSNDSYYLQQARRRLVRAYEEVGRTPEALALVDDVIRRYRATRPGDHVDVARVSIERGWLLAEHGREAEAREVLERAVVHLEAQLPADHADLRSARSALAETLRRMGDLHGARALQESVLATASRLLPPDAQSLQIERMNLAGTLIQMQELESARLLLEPALATLLTVLPHDHRSVQLQRVNLAQLYEALGEHARAAELLAAVIEVHRTSGQTLRPFGLAARATYGRLLAVLGQDEAAAGHLEAALAGFEAVYPAGHPWVLRARMELAWMRVRQGRRDEAQRLAEQASHDLRACVRESAARLSPREMEGLARNLAPTASALLAFAAAGFDAGAQSALDRSAFAAIEALRSSELIAALVARRAGGEPRTPAQRAEEAELRARLAYLARSGSSADELARTRRELEALRRDAIQRLEPGTAEALRVDPTPERLSRDLKPGEALVACWTYEPGPPFEPRAKAEPALLAFVLRSEGVLARVELGAARAVEDDASGWLRAIGAGAGGLRGLDAEATRDTSGERLAGEALRARVLAPLAGALVGVDRIVVALDGALLACPLGALPEADGRLGDRLAIEVRSSLIELALPRRSAESVGGRLVAFGGIRFEPEGDDEGDDGPSVRPAAPVLARVEPAGGSVRRLRGAASAGFAPLPGTGEEVRQIGALFAAAFPRQDAALRSGAEATREALFGLAGSARWLHLATHGWFSPESVSGRPGSDAPLDARLGVGERMSPSEFVTGVSPMALCGLALAGANAPPDEFGCVAGAATAEELAGLDLSDCELAVLSACDTSVGVRAAGQGVHSLQRALHMAGARSVVTSLWKVPDDATRALMIAFYRGLWERRLAKDRALWEAQRSLRDARTAEGLPLYGVADWAAWRLTGESD